MFLRTRMALCLIALPAVLLFRPARLAATPILYTMSGNLSGTLETATLSHVPFTFAFGGLTENIVTDPNALLNPALTNRISLEGVGTGQFLDPILVAVNNVGGFGGFLTLGGSGAGIAYFDPGFIRWNLATQIALGAVPATQIRTIGTFNTSLGMLTVTSVGQDLSFRATIPEPATPVLLGLGLFVLVRLPARRRRQ